MKKTEMIKKAAEAKSRYTGVPAESYERIFKTMTKANLELQLHTYTTLLYTRLALKRQGES